MFYENYLTSDFDTKHYYFKKCLPTCQNGIENRDKAYCNITNLKYDVKLSMFKLSPSTKVFQILVHVVLSRHDLW